MFDLIYNLIFTELPSPPLVDPRGLQRRPLPLEQLRAEGNCDLRAAAALNRLTRVATIMHFSCANAFFAAKMDYVLFSICARQMDSFRSITKMLPFIGGLVRLYRRCLAVKNHFVAFYKLYKSCAPLHRSELK